MSFARALITLESPFLGPVSFNRLFRHYEVHMAHLYRDETKLERTQIEHY
jgi:hypothetical protein